MSLADAWALAHIQGTVVVDRLLVVVVLFPHTAGKRLATPP
jgi:hypothetical protein